MEQKRPFLFTAPKNFKQGRLIMNRFRLSDLLLVVAGAAISVLGMIIYVAVLEQFNLIMFVILLLPAVITFFLTLSAGIFHNNLEFMKIVLKYSLSNKNYIWEGIYKHDSIQEK
jgi:hypothetical protein